MLRLAIALLVLSAALLPTRAHAYEERATLELGLAPTLRLGPDVVPGFALDAITTWGISESWSLGGSVRYGWNHDDTFRNVVIPAFEATWALDIVRIVPRITLGVGPVLPLERGRSPALDLNLRLGIDRLTNFGLYGFDLRFDTYGPAGVAGAGRVTISLGFRVGLTVDRF